MFKNGETVELTCNEGQYIVGDKFRIVTNINGSIDAFGSNGGYFPLIHANGQPSKYFNSFKKVQPMQSKYKIGDRVVYRRNQMDQIIFKILDVKEHDYLIKYEGPFSRMKDHILSKKMVEDFEHELYSTETVSNSLVTCTCESRVVFNKGCQCGAFKLELKAKVSHAS